MAYIPPSLSQPSHYGPRHKGQRLERLGQILMIAAAVGLVAFLAAVITAIVTGSGG